MKCLRIFLVGCALLTAYGAASLWRDRHNTLELYPEWKSAKTALGMGVNGAHSFTLTPISLLGRALNLAAWHSQQEVGHAFLWQHVPTPFRARIYAEGSSEWSLMARYPSGDGDFALRLSSRGRRPSAWLMIGPDRQILSKEVIGFDLPGKRWTEVSLYTEGDQLVLFVDGKQVSSRAKPSAGFTLSFHGHSEAGVLRMDDVSFGGSIGGTGEHFSGRFPYAAAVLGAMVLAALLLALERFAGMRPAFAAALALATFSGLALATYDSLIGNQYPRWVPLQGKSTIETREQVLARLGELRPSGKPVLLWLGGSQAWGAGASRAEKSAFGRLAAELGSAAVEPVNGAISAATLEDQLEPLRVVSTRRRVEAVVLTTGVNDALNDSFPEKLRLVASAVRQRGAKLLLVVEPVDQPVPEAVRKRQAELRAFAAAEKIPLLDLQPVLDRETDSGYLWWDFVHLSDAGAAVVAAELREPVKRLLSAPQ